MRSRFTVRGSEAVESRRRLLLSPAPPSLLLLMSVLVLAVRVVASIADAIDALALVARWLDDEAGVDAVVDRSAAAS